MTLEHRRLDNTDQTHGARNDLPAGSAESRMQHAADPARFEKDEFVVYPAHGIGQITAIEVQTVAGSSLEFFVIYFSKSKLRARVPTKKAVSIGMRKPSNPAAIEQVRRTLSQASSRARMNWARLIKEYETKIKSGEIIALAEVVRDLHRRSTQPDQSYSERQLYATALDRLSAEVALVEDTTEEKAALQLESLLLNRTGKTAV